MDIFPNLDLLSKINFLTPNKLQGVKMNVLKVLITSIFLSLNVIAQDITTKWANESEAGLTSTQSAQSATLDTNLYYGKHKTTVEKGSNTLSVFGNYFYGKQGDELNARHWMAGFKWDKAYSKILKAFLAETVEGNRFMGYVLRSNTDVGGKYYFLTQDEPKDLDYFFAELGYRLSFEDLTNNRTGASSTSNQGRAYSEYSKAWTATFSSKLWVEYIKTFGNDNRDMLNSEISGLTKMSDILSMKASYLVRYDDTLKDKSFERNTTTMLMVALIANY